MDDLPSGTVTLLFTDIEGSTRLLRGLGPAYNDVLGQHDRLLRAAFESHGGHEVDTQGDAFYVAFNRAGDAIAAAVEAQRSLTAAGWPDGGEVRVRMGLHTAEPTAAPTRYVGLGVHRAARICSAGHGGQILVSSATRELLEDDLPAGLSCRDIGQYRLKDFERPERVFQIAGPGLRQGFPPLTAPPAAAPPRSRRPMLIAAAALGAIAVAGVAVLVLADGDDGGLAAISENAVGLIDPDGGRITRQHRVGNGPIALTSGGGSVWALNAADRSVSRIDGRRNERVAIPLAGDLAGLAFAGGSLWVTDRQGGTVSRISAETNRLLSTTPAANAPGAIAAGFGAVWVASEVDRTVVRIDVARGIVTKTIDVGAGPTALAVGAGAVWVASEEGGTVFRIEPRTGVVVKPIDVGNGPIGVAVDDHGVWVLNRQDATVSRIDPSRNAVTYTRRVGRDPRAIAVGAGSTWVANGGDATVSRLTGEEGGTSPAIRVGGSPSALVVADGLVWTAALAAPATHRGGTLRVQARPFEVKHLDAGDYGVEPSQIVGLAYDGLVGYRRAGGATYGTLVGNLAQEVPEPSADGRTYVFTLRKDIRYANGERVRAADFRASLASVIARHGLNLPAFYDAIAGAPTCRRRPKRCDLSRGIVTDDRSRTITIRLTRPDPDLLHKLAVTFAVVVPRDQPFGKAEPPGTGPYRIASFNPRGARLVRNPHFHVWSNDARPDGFPDEIVIRPGDDAKEKVASVRRGAYDLVLVASLFGSMPPADVAALTASAPGNLYTDAEPELDYLFLNVRRPPFDDARVRRALNYAVDRRAIEAAAGGPDLAQLTCQVVPPGFPGYAPACHYTAAGGRVGAWSGPDMQRARTLVKQSGTARTPVTVLAYEDQRAVMTYVASVLRELGYRVSLRVYPNYMTYGEAEHELPNGGQIGINGWSADYNVPSTFSLPFVCSEVEGPKTFGANLSRFCDQDLEALIDRAETADRSERNVRWRAAYDYIADQAPLVPLVNRRTVALVSSRVGNYQHHPLWGTLLDQLWVR